MRKELRVKKSQEFSEIMNYKRYYNSDVMTLYVKPKKEEINRVGLSVGKKIGNVEIYPTSELQEFVNTLPLEHHINVRNYYKFSNLMQRIMYEYGCFDNVYELAGTLRDNIRNEITFPNRVITTKTINERGK